MKVYLVTAVTAVFVLLDLLTGNAGLSMALVLCPALYFAVVYRRRYGFIAAAAAAVVLEAIYFREWMLAPALYPLILLAALSVVNNTGRSFPLSVLSGGGTIGALMWLANVMQCVMLGLPLPEPDAASVLVFQVVFSALTMLVFTVVADFFAFKCNLPRFSMNKKGEFSRSGDE